MRRERVEAVTIGLACSWELIAFASHGYIPTITSTVAHLPRWARAALIGSIWWWTIGHFGIRRAP